MGEEDQDEVGRLDNLSLQVELKLIDVLNRIGRGATYASSEEIDNLAAAANSLCDARYTLARTREDLTRVGSF